MTTTAEREEARKRQQGYDPDPPRCGTCVYYTLGSHRERSLERKRGRSADHLQRCTFGDFRTTYKGVCDEWRNRDGERLEQAGEGK